MAIEQDPRVARYANVTDLRQYDKQYKVVNDGTNGDEVIERIWEMCIPGKYGQIYPSGFNGDLSVLVTSPKMIGKVVELLAPYRKPGHGNQGGDFSAEVAIRFPHTPDLLHKVAAIISARRSRKGKGRKFTPEQLAAGAARLRAINAARKAAKQQAPVPAAA